MKKILLVILASLFLTSTSLFASANETVYKAKKVVNYLENNGYTLKKVKGGYLSEKGYKTISMTLYKGNTYEIVGVGDSGISDLDVKVYDENWNLVAKDNDTKSISIVKITPKWTGTFYVRTIIYRGSGYWAQIAAWK